jgi:hypothetical protein
MFRRRSPSPIKTGAVNRVRNRFEGAAGDGYSHQTLPKAFKLGASSRVNLAEKTVAPKYAAAVGRISEPPVVATSRVMSDTLRTNNNDSWQPSRHSSFSGGNRGFGAPPNRPYQTQNSNGSSGWSSSGSLYYAPSTFSSAVKSIPGRFLNQDIMRDAASFLSQRLPGLSGGGSNPDKSSSGSSHFQRPVIGAGGGDAPGYIKTPFGRQDR